MKTHTKRKKLLQNEEFTTKQKMRIHNNRKKHSKIKT